MKSLRYALLVLPLLSVGCILVSGQFLVNFDLGTIQVDSPTAVIGRDVNLNDIGDYNDHKDELKGLADVAVLGVITIREPSPSTSTSGSRRISQASPTRRPCKALESVSGGRSISPPGRAGGWIGTPRPGSSIRSGKPRSSAR